MKDSLNRKKFKYHPQPTMCLTSHRTIWFAHIFSQRENFSLFDAWFFVFLLFYFRSIVIYCFYPCCFAFYFTVKNALFSTLNSQTFFFLRENSSLFLIKLLNTTSFSDVAALLFLCSFFSFSSWKPLSVPYGFRLIYAPLHPMLLSFFCVKFSLNKQRQNAIFLMFLRCIVIFCVLQFYFIPVKITLFSA